MLGKFHLAPLIASGAVAHCFSLLSVSQANDVIISHCILDGSGISVGGKADRQSEYLWG